MKAAVALPIVAIMMLGGVDAALATDLKDQVKIEIESVGRESRFVCSVRPELIRTWHLQVFIDVVGRRSRVVRSGLRRIIAEVLRRNAFRLRGWRPSNLSP